MRRTRGSGIAMGGCVQRASVEGEDLCLMPAENISGRRRIAYIRFEWERDMAGVGENRVLSRGAFVASARAKTGRVGHCIRCRS